MVVSELAGAAASTFPNVGGYVSVTYDNAIQYLPSIIISIGLIIFMAIFIYAMYSFCKMRKSKAYRELITDMYVVGMIKKFATDDNVDIVKELRDFLKMEKKARLAEKYLDEVVEGELKEKISKINEKAIED